MLFTALQANEYTAYHLICFSFTHTENTNYDGLVGELHSCSNRTRNLGAIRQIS